MYANIGFYAARAAARAAARGDPADDVRIWRGLCLAIGDCAARLADWPA